MTELPAILALFPGQGSQQVGMGQELQQQSPIARELFATADAALGFALSEICFNGPLQRLTMTEIVQPAVLTVSSICFQIAQEKWGERLKIAAAAGHSLGEYSALVAAGALSFSDTVKLVHKRGQYMQAAVPLGQGKMLAVMGRELAELEELCRAVAGVVEIANINAPGQIVVAGAAAAVDQLKEKLTGSRVVELPVSAPFHCGLMQPAQERLAADLDQLEIKAPRFPVYANYSAAATVDPAEIRANLKAQVCGRVRWVASMERAIAEQQPTMAVEFGQGNVLSGLLKRINKELPRAGAGSLADLNGLPLG